MKVLPYFHGHFGPLIKSLISSSIGDDIVPLVAVHATRALNNHPINSTIFFTCNLRFSNSCLLDRQRERLQHIHCYLYPLHHQLSVDVHGGTHSSLVLDPSGVRSSPAYSNETQGPWVP